MFCGFFFFSPFLKKENNRHSSFQRVFHVIFSHLKECHTLCLGDGETTIISNLWMQGLGLG